MKINQLRLIMLITIVLYTTYNASTFRATASPSSSYYYKFTVDTEGFTNVEVNFGSTDASGLSWVLVPKFSSWNYTVTSGSILQQQPVDTSQVMTESLYFYQAFKFSFTTISDSFAMTVCFGFPSGALIIESRGIFFSPQIGFQKSSSGKAEVLFDNALTVNPVNAIAIGSHTYALIVTPDLHHVLLDPLPENLLRLQMEFTTNLSTQSTTLTSQNGVFTFTSPNRYLNYASNILNLYDRLYNNYTHLFNAYLTPPVGVQFFLPSFSEFLSVGGFTPFTKAGAGEMNVNVFFIRAVNGTVEVIAAHELVHHFLTKAGLSPNDFLWFHEGMAQYVSVTFVEKLGYEGARQEKSRLEEGASQLIQGLGGENLGFLQNWSPSTSPIDVSSYYVAAYFVVSRLAQEYSGLDSYQHFFELISGVTVDDINILTLYLSKAANASVALTLKEWGFSVIDLYAVPEISQKIVETQRAIAGVSPLFQPYKFLAEFFYRQALFSFKWGDIEGGNRFLQLATIIADLAPLFTLLTIAALLGIVALVLLKRSKRAKLKQVVLPVPPPEIFPKSEQ
jgi:hypothetical protein